MLNDAGIGIASPTLVAREFNRRYLDKPVTTQAVRKWLNGEAIPAGDKIRVLAKWLKTSPHWLHYGENEKSSGLLKIEAERNVYREDALATLPTVMAQAPPQAMKLARAMTVPPPYPPPEGEGTRSRYASFTLMISGA